MSDKSTKSTATTLPTVEPVNPAQVVIGDNIRAAADLSAEFVASVARHGVIVPISAYRDQDGQVVVIDGQRRTLAAVQADLEAIPALIGDSPEDTDRIVRQWVSNEARAAMTEGDRFEAIRQMTLIGQTAAQISEQMSGVTKADVRAVKKADKAGVTRERVEETPQVSLLDQAVLAEFADDPDALAFLRGATGEHLTRRVQQWHQDQERAALLDQAAQQWREYGATVETSRSFDDRRPTPDMLTTREGKPLPEDPETLARMPGVVLILSVASRSVPTEASEGEETTYQVEDYVRIAVRVADAAKSGYMRRVEEDGTLLDAEQAKAKRRAAREAKDLWASVQRSRREFIASLLDAKSLPGAERIAATGLIYGGVTPHQVAPLFGVDPDKITGALTRQRTTAKRRIHVAAVAVLMAWEAGVSQADAGYPSDLDRFLYGALVKAGWQPTDTDKGLGGTDDERAPF